MKIDSHVFYFPSKVQNKNDTVERPYLGRRSNRRERACVVFYNNNNNNNNNRYAFEPLDRKELESEHLVCRLSPSHQKRKSEELPISVEGRTIAGALLYRLNSNNGNNNTSYFTKIRKNISFED